MLSESIISEIHSLSNPSRALISQRFFKTGKGQYGEGDIFLGLTMPQLRIVVKKHCASLTLEDTEKLLEDKHHEIRMAGALVLVYFAQKKVYPLEKIAKCYMRNAGFKTPFLKGDGKISGKKGDLLLNKSSVTPSSGQLLQEGARTGINNWDLVDVSSEHVIGPYTQECLSPKERIKFMNDCVSSRHLWTNRIIVLASFCGIKRGDPSLIYALAQKMIDHKHDLMHKAIGWMLREAGKRCSMVELRGFLNQYASNMPRTMLRYAIEKMDEKERKKYLGLTS